MSTEINQSIKSIGSQNTLKIPSKYPQNIESNSSIEYRNKSKNPLKSKSRKGQGDTPPEVFKYPP